LKQKFKTLHKWNVTCLSDAEKGGETLILNLRAVLRESGADTETLSADQLVNQRDRDRARVG